MPPCVNVDRMPRFRVADALLSSWFPAKVFVDLHHASSLEVGDHHREVLQPLQRTYAWQRKGAIVERLP